MSDEFIQILITLPDDYPYNRAVQLADWIQEHLPTGSVHSLEVKKVLDDGGNGNNPGEPDVDPDEHVWEAVYPDHDPNGEFDYESDPLDV